MTTLVPLDRRIGEDVLGTLISLIVQHMMAHRHDPPELAIAVGVPEGGP